MKYFSFGILLWKLHSFFEVNSIHFYSWLNSLDFEVLKRNACLLCHATFGAGSPLVTLQLTLNGVSGGTFTTSPSGMNSCGRAAEINSFPITFPYSLSKERKNKFHFFFRKIGENFSNRSTILFTHFVYTTCEIVFIARIKLTANKQ